MQPTNTSRHLSPRARGAALERGFKTKAEKVATGVRQELGLSALDPFDPWRHADRRGVQILELHQLLEHGFPQSGISHFSRNSRVSAAYDIVDGSPFVLLFGECAPTRRLSDLAHELSHHELGHRPTEPFDSIGCRRWNPVQEEEANWLAGCLLIPANGALAILKRGLSFEDAADTFGVSLKMFTWRANMTGAPRKLRLTRSAR